MSQQEEVRNFFNNTAAEYGAKYHTKDFYYKYFFRQRLHAATQNQDLNNKTILDIGAGTGGLYDYLLAQHKNVNFYATDLSDKMLKQSKIPFERQFVGKCFEVGLPNITYDFIFMLGVTSYMTQEELFTNLNYIKNHLGNSGRAIISFTNRASLDFIIRSFIKFFLRPLRISNKVMGQSFRIYAYRRKEITKLLEENFAIKNITLINQTVFPFCLFFKKTSIRFARLIEKYFTGWLRLFFSSDFVVTIQKNSDRV